MTLAHSSNIVTNGLVFYHDMGNSKKSWKGKPTTNLVPQAISSYTLENSCTAVATGEYYNECPVYRVTFPAGTLPRFYYNFAYTTSQQYNASIYYKFVSGNESNPAIFLREAGFGTSYVSSTFTYTDQWTRASINYTFGASGTCMFLVYRSNSATTTNIVLDIAMPQCELGAFPTPYVNGTRSNTQAVLDLVGGNTITATSLTYASDGSFSFNGSSDVIAFPNNTALDTQTPTVEVWVKTNATTQNGFWFEKGTVNSQYALFQEGSNIQWRLGPLGDLSTNTSTYMNTTNWYQVVGTYVSGDRRLYINGNQVNSNSTTGTLSVNNSGCSIGAYGGFSGSRGYYYNGSIGNVKIYNRALTAAEVKQNFNALRGRYGI